MSNAPLTLLNASRSALAAAGYRSVDELAGANEAELAKLHGKRNVGRHKEAPELKITTECGAAVKELKKLAKKSFKDSKPA